jgi:peptidoglycan/xylan/chitin deacetylase (PgdA/CDA1 family)
MLPSVAKTATSCLLHWSGLDRWQDITPLARKLPVVIGYHRVVENFSYAAMSSIPSMLISSQMFERHLDLLCKQYRPISLDELAEAVESGKPLDRPTAVITFDDGYRDVYYQAFPILKRKGIPAAVFIVTGLVDTEEIPLHDRLYRSLLHLFPNSPSAPWVLAALLRDGGISSPRVSLLRSQSKDPYRATRAILVALSRRELLRLVSALEEKTLLQVDAAAGCRAMSWEMLAEMQRAGFTIGSHTRTHAVLTNECREQVYDELKASREHLELHLGKPAFHLAYPDGRFSFDILQAAAETGYRYAYTTCQHSDPAHPLLTIPRTVLWENSWLDFRGHLSASIMNCQLSGLFDLIAGCDQNHRMPASQSQDDAELQHAEQRQ